MRFFFLGLNVKANEEVTHLELVSAD